MSDLDAYVSVYGHDGKPTLVKKIHSRMDVSETVLLAWQWIEPGVCMKQRRSKVRSIWEVIPYLATVSFINSLFAI